MLRRAALHVCNLGKQLQASEAKICTSHVSFNDAVMMGLRGGQAAAPQHLWGRSQRGMSSGPEEGSQEITRVKQLAEEIMHLNLLEIADLTEILQKRLGLDASQMQFGQPGGGGGGAPAAAAAAAPEPAKEVQTEFNVKLEGFEAASKIKVIKEIRALSELGLKEAKELVESSPVVVKAGLKKEEAEELKKRLEAVGAKIALE